MSAPTLSSLPRFGPSSTDLFDFDGGEELWSSWRDGLKPDPLLMVSQWADAHRFLSPRASAEPGRYRTDRTPYMRAIMDALSPSHPARRIVFMKAAQVGATEAGNNWIGYVIHHAPGPMLAVQPTVELAWFTKYLDPAFFAYVVIAGGACMGLALAAQILISLWEMWIDLGKAGIGATRLSR